MNWSLIKYSKGFCNSALFFLYNVSDMCQILSIIMIISLDIAPIYLISGITRILAYSMRINERGGRVGVGGWNTRVLGGGGVKYMYMRRVQVVFMCISTEFYYVLLWWSNYLWWFKKTKIIKGHNIEVIRWRKKSTIMVWTVVDGINVMS